MCLASFVLCQQFQNMNHNSLQASEIHTYFGRWCLKLHISHDSELPVTKAAFITCVNEEIVQNENICVVYCGLLIYGYSFLSCFGVSEEQLVAQLYSTTLCSLQGVSLLRWLLKWLHVRIEVCSACRCFKDRQAQTSFPFRKA